MGSKLKRLLKTLLKFAVTAAALYFVIRKIELKEVLALYSQSNLVYITLALIFFALSKLVSAYRLNIYFRTIDIHLKEKTNIELYLLGMFYNLFLPGGIGGDGYKVYLLQKKYQAGTKKIIGAVLSDRISGMVALVVLALLGISILNPEVIGRWSLDVSRGLLFSSVVIAIVTVFLAYYLFTKIAYPYFLKINILTFTYGFLVQLLQVACAWFLLLALGEHENHLSYLVIFLVSSAVAVLPVSIGGMGVRELTFLYGSQILNVDMNVAVGISFLFYLITATVSLTGVWYIFRPVKL
ncbi:MAG TPA: lysylphosphatidylglycerol synthase transmembrane domain-containing protein [Bacteroidales bacterium]|nr:lysylphosphatidylglycerol synthase transmembrane domain-containing protein [Bacteroidales bacterium]HPI86005.1 lysylphosphatidylglycerol synthase transmembrane domain-containing protein [Bacteroidales bacterium]HPM91697.1 lysylphosphatidylglycerol synthase transmembrane domain-containing protein [Bacteroidales bacterium]